MAENTSVIDLKKRKLKEESESEEPNKRKIKRLEESIKRHKDTARYIRDRRVRTRERHQGRWKKNLIKNKQKKI